MEKETKIQNAYKESKSYPELVKALIAAGVGSYTVDVPSGARLYRFNGGEHILHNDAIIGQSVAEKFSEEKTVQAIRENQQGKTSYPQFMEGIAAAGVRFYEATLNGDRKRVTYIGIGGSYEELIPV